MEIYMTKKLHTILISLVILAIVLGCTLPGTTTVIVVTATAETTTDPGTEDSNTPVAESTAVPVASNTDVAECKLPDRPLDNPNNYWRLGIPRHPGFAPSVGAIQVTVLFVDYSDARATSTPQDVFALLNTSNISQFFSDISYGNAQVDIQPFPKWLNLQQSSIERGADFLNESFENRRIYFQEAITLADPEFDFSETDIILVVRNPDAPDSSATAYSVAEDSLGFQVDGTSIRAALAIGDVLIPGNEEFLRNNYIASQFVAAMTIPSPLFGREVPDDVVRNSTVGAFGVRGFNWDTQHAPGPFAFERWQLGWLQDDQIICHTAGEQTVELSAIENVGGTKAVMVPLGDSCGLIVESRRAVGTDEKLVKQGALVYTVNTGVEMSVLPRVYGMPIRVLPANDNDLNRDQAPLALGESLTYSNVTVTNVDERADGDTILVTINGSVSCDEDVASATVQGQNTPIPATVTKSLPFQVVIDANNCPVIKNATQVICYDITGSTEAELVAEMKALTPRAPDWYGIDTFISWTWDASCTPSSLNVTLDYQKPFFPRWTPPANASPALVTKWQNFIQNQAVRAQMEVDYINQHYLEIYTPIQNDMKQGCSNPNGVGDQAIDSLYKAAWASIDQVVPQFRFP
jgi:hypothetical protein